MKKILVLFSILFLLLIAGCYQENVATYYTIEFQTDGGSSVASQTIEEGKKASKPANPTKEGYVFSGWYIKETKFDFNTSITEDLTLTAHWQDEIENFGMPVIVLTLSDISISQSGYYISMEEVGAYIYTYHKLPQNYRTKSQFNKNEYTKDNKLSVGGDQFYNRERLLPYKDGRTYTECDIDYKGTSRGSKRIVYSSDFLIFYTDNHYSSFSILRFI